MEKRTLFGKNLRAEEASEAPRIVADFVVFGDVYDMGWGAFERIDPHAFDNTLSGDIRALIDHDTALVLGRTKAGTLRLWVDDYALRGEIDINPDDRAAMDLYARVKRGDVSQCSFGFEIVREEREEMSNGVMWTIMEVKLWEVSVVTFPAYQATSAVARSSASASRAMEDWKNRMKARLSNDKTRIDGEA